MTRKVTFLTVLRNRGFRNLWIGQVVSQVGDYFAFLAMMVIVSGFSSDPGSTVGAVSGMMIAFALPRLLFGMLAGVFVDRWDRRRTMLVSDLIRALLVLAMIPAFMTKNLLLMYALGFTMSAIGTLFLPAKGALIPKLVANDELMSANALSQTSMMLANFVGPALAGAAFAIVGTGNEWIAFVIDSVSFFVSAVAIYLISVPAEVVAHPVPLADRGQPSAIRGVWEEFKVGLKALLLNRTIASLAAVFAITMLGVGALNVLWVVFFKEKFGFQSAELAWRLSIVDIAFAAGMVGSTVIVGNVLSHVAPKWLVVGGLVVAGAVTMIVGFLPDYLLVALDMFVIGAGVGPINTGVSTLMQIVVPNKQLGRVGGGFGTVNDAANLLSMSVAGVAGAMLGIPVVFALSGAACVIGGLLAWVLLPAITFKDRLAGQEPTILETAETSEAQVA